MASQRSKHESEGSAAIEFGIIAPMLLILLMGIVELSNAVHLAMQVQDAAEAGALYAGKKGWNQAGISAAVVNATDATDITASPVPYEFCGCPSTSGITTVSCGTTCTGGGSAETYVKVSASRPYTPILTGLGLPIPSTLTAAAVVRLQ
jgi:Flp pilus assembly protein TadG